MSTLRRFIGLLATAFAVTAASAAALGEVIASFPVPPPLTYVTGLAWDGSYLWGCYYYNPYVYRMTTAGSVVSSFQAIIGGNYKLDGLTYENPYLWVGNSYGSGGYVRVMKFTTAGSQLSYFNVYSPSGGGLTWESPYLWVDSVKTTTTGSWVSSFTHPFINMTDTAYVGHYIWASAAPPWNFVYKWTTSGSTVASFQMPGNGAAVGKTFDGSYLWVANATNNWCYRINIDVVGVTPASFGRVKAIYR